MKLATRSEVARTLGVSPATISRWAKLGIIPGKLNRIHRYDLDAVSAALDRNSRGNPDPDVASEADAILLKWFKETGYEN